MYRRLIAAMGLWLLFGAMNAPAALAGAEPQPAPDDSSGDERLDELRALIPEGFPGKYDLTEADSLFEALVSAYGESTDVEDFGTGSTLTGQCGGWAYSYDSDGNLLDAAADTGDDSPPIDLLDGGQALTSGNPFKVDTNGIVVYYGFMPQDPPGPYDHRWEIKTAGVSLDKGGDPNPKGKNNATGIIDLAEDLPVKFNAKAKVEGKLTPDVGNEVAEASTVGPCIGNGHVEFIATGLTPALIGSIAALAGGFFGLLFNARPAMTFRG